MSESEIIQKIELSWSIELKEELISESFKSLTNFLKLEYENGKIIYPASKNIFSAFHLTHFKNVKVVILGQDPYHGIGEAHGLSFSTSSNMGAPASLKNIFKELKNDLGTNNDGKSNLEPWAKQGILLLNATLTVEENKAGSHQKKGWECFTDAVIKKISEKKSGIVFILWGSYAQAKIPLIDTNKHFVLQSVHPSPLSAYRGFFGCKHFSKTNSLLKQQGKKEINWQL